MVLLLGEAEAAAAPLALVIPVGDAALQRLLPVARRARQGGAQVEVGYGARKLTKELERANRMGVDWAVIAGDNELAKGEAVLKEMKTGEQRPVALDRLADELIALARARGR